MKKFYLFILIELFGCTRNNSESLSKLKFPDPVRDLIKANHIDTTFTYYRQEDGSELSEYKTYDENGNVLVESSDHSSVYYKYDNNGLLIKKEVRQYGTSIDSILYQFDSDSTILRQKWSNSKIEYKFLFDEKSRLKQSLKFEETQLGKVLTERSDYTYIGESLKKVIHFDRKNNPYLEGNLYYSPEGILDSATLKSSGGHFQYWNYDSLGLIKSDGSVRYIHKKRM